MKARNQLMQISIPLILLSLMLFACSISAPSKSKESSSDNPAQDALQEATATSQEFQNTESIPGGISFADMNMGLETLSSYHISYVQNVTGSLDGQPYNRETHIELTRVPGQTDFLREISADGELQPYFRVIAADKAVYYWVAADEPCQGVGGEPQKGDIVEPASFLLPVTNAVEVGPEVINQVPAVHYSFDENSLRLSDPKPTVHGDVWVASPGGYVVKYVLVADAPTNLTGSGYEVERSWEYELSEVDSSEAIDLPEGCGAVPVDLPTLPDAAGITLGSGMLSYTTGSSAADVLNFYLEQLELLGWSTSQAVPAQIEVPYDFSFTKGDQNLSLNLDRLEGSTLDVILLLVQKPPQESVSAGNEITPVPTDVPGTSEEPGSTEVPQPVPTIVVGENGLPEDIPVYPGAEIVMQYGEFFQFETGDAVDDVAEFYKAEMESLGWEKLVENITSDATTIVWEKGSRMATVSITIMDGKTSIMVMPTTQ